MLALASVASMVLALSLARPLARRLAAQGLTRVNHRGVPVARPSGLLIIIASLPVAAAVMTLAAAGPAAGQLAAATIFVTGVALLGLVDDLLGDRGAAAPRGLRRHARALATRRVSTGAIKALGTALLALVALSGLSREPAEWALGAAVLTLSAHAFNLLDLRPGRAIKVLLAVGAGLCALTLSLAPLGPLAIFLAPVTVLLLLDLRERAMLGDTGAGAVGAIAGLLIVFALGPVGQLVALAALLAAALYGELRSISDLVERRPLLRKLDSAGRCA